eukprot:UN23657
MNSQESIIDLENDKSFETNTEQGSFRCETYEELTEQEQHQFFIKLRRNNVTGIDLAFLTPRDLIIKYGLKEDLAKKICKDRTEEEVVGGKIKNFYTSLS